MLARYLLGLLGLIPPLELGLVVLLPFKPLLPDPVVPFAASGYFFNSASHCESFCIAVGDMPSHFVHCVFSLLVMLDADAAKPAPAKAAVMQMPRAKVTIRFILNLLISPGGRHP
jgi:hypothetical protein